MPGSPTPLPPSSGSGTRRRIGRVLVIDDDEAIRVALRAAYGGSYDVVMASTGEEALARLSRGETYDVLLCEMIMPGIDGMTLHAHLMTAAPDQASRIVFMSDGAFTARLDAFFRRVPNLLLAKPLDVQALGDLLAWRVEVRSPPVRSGVAGER